MPGAPSRVPIGSGCVPGCPAPRGIAARVDAQAVVGPCLDVAPLLSGRAGTSGRTAADQDERGRNGLEAGPTDRLHATAGTDADEQLRDVALTLDLARSSYAAWQATNPDASPGTALRYAYHTHEALHELSRSVNRLIETFRVEAARLARHTAGRHRHPHVVPMTPHGLAEGGRLSQ